MIGDGLWHRVLRLSLRAVLSSIGVDDHTAVEQPAHSDWWPEPLA